MISSLRPWLWVPVTFIVISDLLGGSHCSPWKDDEKQHHNHRALPREAEDFCLLIIWLGLFMICSILKCLIMFSLCCPLSTFGILNPFAIAGEDARWGSPTTGGFLAWEQGRQYQTISEQVWSLKLSSFDLFFIFFLLEGSWPARSTNNWTRRTIRHFRNDWHAILRCAGATHFGSEADRVWSYLTLHPDGTNLTLCFIFQVSESCSLLKEACTAFDLGE